MDTVLISNYILYSDRDELISPSKIGDTQTNSALDDTPGCSKDSAEDLKRRKLLARAPVVPFDSDLKYWGQSKINVPTIVKNDLSKFWNLADADEEFVPAGVEESLRNRSMLFPGEFQSVKWRCRAPLPNGKLCPRQDRLVRWKIKEIPVSEILAFPRYLYNCANEYLVLG